MNNTSNIFIEILDEERRKTFAELTKVSEGWYLAGGTALALQIRHRISFDFDFFSQKKISKDFRATIVKIFGDQLHFSMDSPDQLSFFTSSNVKITFAYTPYKPLYELIQTPFSLMEDVRDIAADKAFTLGRRGVFRDYVDLFFLLSNRVSLNRVIPDAERKYGALFDEKLFLEQLNYLEDITDLDITFIGKAIPKNVISSLLHSKIEEYLEEKSAAL